MFTIKDYIVGEIIECPTIEIARKVLKERFTEYVENQKILIQVLNESSQVVKIERF